MPAAPVNGTESAEREERRDSEKEDGGRGTRGGTSKGKISRQRSKLIPYLSLMSLDLLFH